jgi:RND family efflux transporter MFP subunit
VQLSPQRIALAGVQTVAVESRSLVREIHVVGVLDYNETKVAHISARVTGRADELFLRYTGQAVKEGEALYSLYSPELYAAQREYLLARKRVNELPADASPEAKADAAAVYNASMQKLVLWGVTRAQLDKMDAQYDRTGQVPTHLTITSPISGIVIRKDLFEGGYVNVGDRPYTIADLDTLWLQARVWERDVPMVQIGQSVQVTVEALPGQTFPGTVAFRAFQIDPQTRTLDARIVVQNQRSAAGELRLRPGMFANAAIRVPVVDGDPPATTAPASTTMTKACADAFGAALEPYLQAQTLLSQDKAQTVSDLLHQSLAAMENLCDTGRTADAFARLTQAVHKTRGQDLAALRETFKAVSAEMIAIGKATGLPPNASAAHVFRCPMAKADWLQTGSETANPYYGSRMLTCGAAVEALPRASAMPATASWASTSPARRVLAIPRSSVIDTGRHKVVYVESSPGVFDMRAVRLGALAGEYYPVLEGLTAGEKVVTMGAFLIDAENRLTAPTATEHH